MTSMRVSSSRLIVPRRAAVCSAGTHTSGSNSPRLMASSGAGSASRLVTSQPRPASARGGRIREDSASGGGSIQPGSQAAGGAPRRRGVGETARVGERYEVTQMPQLNCQRGPCYRLRQRYRVRLSLLHVRLPMQRLVIVLPTPESCLARYWVRIPGFPSLRIGNERSTPSTQPNGCARRTMPGDGFVTTGQWKNDGGFRL